MTTILVPLDGSRFAEHALPLAMSIARRRAGDVRLVCVHETPPLQHGVQGAPMHDLSLDQRRDAEARAELQHYLDDVRRRLAESDADVPVATTLLDGPVVSTLAKYTRDATPGLVVMTTHGRGGARRLLLGSVTEGMVRRTAIPVLAVRPAENGGTAPVTAVQRVLVCVDGTAESERVIAPLADLFGTGGVEYTLFRVVPPLHPLARTVATAAEYDRDLGVEQQLTTDYLQELSERVAPTGLEVDVATRGDEAPAAAIVAAARELEADVIALATHARGTMGRLVHGSVADHVLRTAPTPVLLVHRP